MLLLTRSGLNMLKWQAAVLQAKEKANRVEEQLQELTTKLAAMETEKHSLAARNKVLETALATAKGMPGRVGFHPQPPHPRADQATTAVTYLECGVVVARTCSRLSLYVAA